MTDTTQSLWLDARYIDDHVLLTSHDAWTWVLIPGLRTNLPTQEEINYLVTAVERVIDGIGEQTFELHYHLAYRDLDTKAWAKRLAATATAPTPAWEDYLERMRQRLRAFGFQDRVLYLGVRLGARTALEKPQLRGATPMQHVKAWMNSLAKAAAGVDPQPSPKEVERWRELAAKTRQALGTSMLDAVPARADDMAWLIRHLQRLGMPDKLVPEKVAEWGAGTIHALAEGVVDNTDPTALTLQLTGRNKNLASHWEQYEQRKGEVEGTGLPQPQEPHTHFTSHVAVLGLANLPDRTANPWLFHAAALPFPVEVSARIQVLSHEQAEKETAKALLHQKNALEDAEAAGLAGHSRDMRRARDAAQLHTEIVEGRGARQITATYRLVVSGPTRAAVGARAEEVIRHYREDNGTDITVQWPPGDQFALWEKLIPGQKRRTGLYTQRQDLVTFCVGLPFSVSTAGDGEGPFVGLVEHGNPTPVFYDLATAAKRGRATTVAITGSSGGGKTFFLLTLMDHMRLRGYPLIALDPKGDIKGHLLLQGRGDARFFDLSVDGKAGSLDPFRLVPYQVDPNDPERATPEAADSKWREETRALVSDVLDQLLGDVYYDRMATVVRLALNAEMEQPRPSMAHLLDVLARGGVGAPEGVHVDPSTLSEYRMAAIGAHAHLRNAAESALGRLMFAPASAQTEDMFAGGVSTTIVSLSGLDLPRDGKPPATLSERFSVALFSLVAHQARRMLQEIDYVGPRALIIDEAHQITGLPSGRSLIISNARMGRSRDIAMVLATQSTTDLLGDDLRNVIPTVFAFRTSGRAERAEVASLLGREPDDPTVARLLPDQNSDPGRCLFLDLDKNLVSMRVDRWAAEYDKAFDTNPDRQNVSAAGTKVQTDAFGVVRDPMGSTRPTPARPAPPTPESARPGRPSTNGVPALSPTVAAPPPAPQVEPAPPVPEQWHAPQVASPVGTGQLTSPSVPSPAGTPVAQMVTASTPAPGGSGNNNVEDAEGWWTS